MNCKKLLQHMIGLVLVVLLLVGGCAPAATPTPDSIATGVAEAKAVAATLTAEAKAVAATLTAEAEAIAATLTAEAPTAIPTATPTVIVTDTPVPTATPTPTPVPPTATPVPPTPTPLPPTSTPIPTNTPTSMPTPTPVPTTGSVEGRLIGRDTDQYLVGAFIVLCEITGDFKCTLRADLTATTDSEGWFTVKEVPAGQYTVAYAEAEDSAAVSFEDGFTIVVPFKVFEGSASAKDQGLRFEFREEHFLDFEVQGGETTEVEITAWGL